MKAMIIVAWNGSGKLSAIFSGDVFKKVLSVFITAAILKLGQGKKEWSCTSLHCPSSLSYINILFVSV
jgi:hypothetical protein